MYPAALPLGPQAEGEAVLPKRWVPPLEARLRGRVGAAEEDRRGPRRDGRPGLKSRVSTGGSARTQSRITGAKFGAPKRPQDLPGAGTSGVCLAPCSSAAAN